MGQLLNDFNGVQYNEYFFFLRAETKRFACLSGFGNEGTTVIPFSRIVGSSTDNGRCCVKWPDGKEYDAALVFVGKTFYNYYINGLLEVIPSCSI